MIKSIRNQIELRYTTTLKFVCYRLFLFFWTLTKVNSESDMKKLYFINVQMG